MPDTVKGAGESSHLEAALVAQPGALRPPEGAVWGWRWSGVKGGPGR